MKAACLNFTGEAVVEEVGGRVEHEEDLLDVHCDVNPVRRDEVSRVVLGAPGDIPLKLRRSVRTRLLEWAITNLSMHDTRIGCLTHQVSILQSLQSLWLILTFIRVRMDELERYTVLQVQITRLVVVKKIPGTNYTV